MKNQTTIETDPPNISRYNLAEQFGVSAQTIDRWVRNGHLPPPIKLGKGRNSPTRWRQSTVDSFVAEQEISEVSA